MTTPATYRCATCGVTETGPPARLDRYWISVRPPSGRTGSTADLPRRYCGAGRAREAQRDDALSESAKTKSSPHR